MMFAQTGFDADTVVQLVVTGCLHAARCLHRRLRWGWRMHPSVRATVVTMGPATVGEIRPVTSL
jgi:hypothetical protein